MIQPAAHTHDRPDVVSVERAGLRLLVFPALEEAGLVCAISTRPLDVRQPGQQERLVEAVGLDPARAVWARQVHRADVVRVNGPCAEPPAADGLVTAVAGQPLVLRAADCSLILVADPERRAVGIAHAGWKGAARGVVVNLVRALVDEYGSDPGTLLAAVGPTISADHYPVGPEVPANFLKLRRWATEYVRVRDGQIHYDLPGTNVRFLEEAGLARERVFRADLCTFTEKDLLHSFRREGTGSGHQGMVAAWPE